MAYFSHFIEKFRRITYSGRYLPEIDGLRFIAICWVVCLAHLGTYIADAVLQLNNQSSYIHQFLLEGTAGVSFFFIISGFILSLPFAENKLSKGQPVSLKKYFLRRVTRLEPTYIITLLLYFLLRVFVFQYETFGELLPHLGASLLYLHNIIYNSHSTINGVAWSLEVEIQFYLLMPILAYLYLIKNTSLRRIILLALIIAGMFYSYAQQYHIAHFGNKACYFFGGMLLADLYVLDKKNYQQRIISFLGLGLLIAAMFIPGYYASVYWSLAKLACLLIFCWLALNSSGLKKILSFAPIAIIGGMCYTIYLLHVGVLGVLRHQFAQLVFSNHTWINVSIHVIAALAAILVISGVFFLLVEKPTMKRDWYKFNWKKKEA